MAVIDAPRTARTTTPSVLDCPLVYVSGKGGTGKTTVSAALQIAAEQRGRRAVVCELGESHRIPGSVTIAPHGALTEWIRSQPGGVLAAPLLGHSHAFMQFVDAAPGAKELVTVGKFIDLARSGAGGTVIVEPMSVLDYGRMAILSDPTGAVFGIWQPGINVGAELVNEAGALSWSELETRDPGSAKTFYEAVFGWSFADHDMGQMGTYTEWKLGDASIGGMADISGRVPDEVPAHWMVYFAVEDADAAVKQVGELGGEIRFGPVDIPAGRFAMLADPWGAAFAVITPSAQTQ